MLIAGYRHLNLPPLAPLAARRDAPPVTISSSGGGGGGGSAVSVSKVVVLVAVLVGAASALVALVTYWLMRERCASPACLLLLLACVMALYLLPVHCRLLGLLLLLPPLPLPISHPPPRLPCPLPRPPPRSMRRHAAARKRMRGQMKNFKYLMQSLQQVSGGMLLGAREWEPAFGAAEALHAGRL